MAVLFLLLLFCCRSCAVTLQQPPAVAAAVGSSVNLSCSLQLGEENVSERYLYWYMPHTNGTKEWFIHPNVDPKIPTKINGGSLWRTNPRNNTDMTLTIANVRLLYTGTYVCHMSLRIDGKKRGVSGNGTYLLVHERLDISINVSRVACMTEVHDAGHVTLGWDVDGGAAGTVTHGSCRDRCGISAELGIGDAECQGRRNVTAVCVLRYKGSTLTNQSIETACPGFPPGEMRKSQPVFLYVTLLASSLLILLVVTLVSCARRRRRKREEDSSVSYTNLHRKM